MKVWIHALTLILGILLIMGLIVLVIGAIIWMIKDPLNFMLWFAE